MQSWSKESNGNIWIPSMITLPFGTLYPTNVDGEMKWGYSEMVSIPEEEQKNYPDGNGGYYKQKYDTDNQKIYDIFLTCVGRQARSDLSSHAKLQSAFNHK